MLRIELSEDPAKAAVPVAILLNIPDNGAKCVLFTTMMQLYSTHPASHRHIGTVAVPPS